MNVKVVPVRMGRRVLTRSASLSVNALRDTQVGTMFLNDLIRKNVKIPHSRMAKTCWETLVTSL